MTHLNDPRPSGHAQVCLPEQATAAGADFIVVGRPIIDDPGPLAAAYRIARAAHEDAGEKVFEGWGKR